MYLKEFIAKKNKFNINNINFKVENIDAWINQTRLKINYEDDTFKIKFIYSDKIIYELNNGSAFKFNI